MKDDTTRRVRPGLLVIDSSVAINLLASRCAIEIATALDLMLIDTPALATEVNFIDSPPDDAGERERSPASTAAWRAAGILETRDVTAPAYADAIERAAARIGEKDASGIALAGVEGWPLVVDDRKAQRVACTLFPGIELVTTLDVLADAADVLAWDDEQLVQLAFDVRWGGNFLPPRGHAMAAWFQDLIERADEELLPAYQRRCRLS